MRATVRKREKNARTAGKREAAELYRLNGEKEVYIGSTFNQSGIWSTLVGLDGTTIDSRFDELPELADQQELEIRFERHFEAFASENAARLPAIKRVGLSLPGRIDGDRGILIRYNLMPFLKNLDLKSIVERYIPGRPVTVQHNITGLVSMLLEDKELISRHRRILYVSARSGAAHP
jgi:predicted NBD/HSP70 family sugar kinase